MATITKIPNLGDYGVFVDDADLANISLEEWVQTYGDLHLRSLVTIFRDTNIDAERWAELVSAFGRGNSSGVYNFMKQHNITVDTSLPIRERFNITWQNILSGKLQVSKDAYEFVEDTQRTRAPVQAGYAQRVTGTLDQQGHRTGLFAEGELIWHANESGHLTFTPGVCLFSLDNVVGTSTGFAISAPWYERQTEAFRSELDELIAIHSFTPGKMNPGLNEVQDTINKYAFCPEENHIPLVIQSPAGIRGLHYSVTSVVGFKGMLQADSDRLLNIINQGLFADDNVYDHWYSQQSGDFLLFDNSITQHRRRGYIQNRMLYRMATSYSNLSKYQYQPYFQPEFQQQLADQLGEMSQYMGIQFKPFRPQ